MNIDVKETIDADELLKELNLDGVSTMTYIATRYKDYMEQFVPKGPQEGYIIKGQKYDNGSLRREVKVYADNETGYVEYEVPYATYQYYGVRADGTHQVHNYTTPGTGKYWDELMMSAVGDKFTEEIEDYIGSKIK